MKATFPLKAFIGAALLAASALLGAQAPTVAVLGIANASGDPRLDYLGGIASGLLSFDLSSLSGIQLVDRSRIDQVLKETELDLSLGKSEDAKKFGGLAGADWLLSGSYALSGGEVDLSLSLTKVADGTLKAFRERGSTENSIHSLAEKVAAALTGSAPSFQDPARERSILSLRDETPGSIALYSPIIDAEVYVDDAFVGYTTGKPTEPFLIDSVSPGKRIVRVHLDKTFGVAALPSYAFSDWSAPVTVQPGRKAVVRDQTRRLSDILYEAAELSSDRVKASDASGLGYSKSLSYVDLRGKTVQVGASVKAAAGNDGLVTLAGTLTVDGKAASLRVDSKKDQDDDIDASAKAGDVELKLSVSRSVSGGYIAYYVTLERRDLDDLEPRQP